MSPLELVSLRPGSLVQWRTWCGPSDVYRVVTVSPWRVSARRVGAPWCELLMSWEATAYRSLGEDMAGVEVVSADELERVSS